MHDIHHPEPEIDIKGLQIRLSRYDFSIALKITFMVWPAIFEISISSAFPVKIANLQCLYFGKLQRFVFRSFITELETYPNKEQCRSDRLPFQMFQNNGLLRALPWYLIYLQILGPKFRINQQKLPNFSGERSYLGHYSAGIMNFAEFWSLPLRVNQFYFFRQLVEWFATTNILPSITSPSWKEITLWNIAFLYLGVCIQKK